MDITDYFDPNFQKSLWEHLHGKSLPYEEKSKVSFYSWFTSMALPAGLAYKPLSRDYNGHCIQPSLVFKLPRGCEQLSIDLLLNTSLMKPNFDKRSQTGLLFSAFGAGGFLNQDTEGKEIVSRRMISSAQDLAAPSSFVVLSKVKKTEQVPIFALSAQALNASDASIFAPLPFESVHEPHLSGWSAVDALRISSNSVRLFLTDAIGEINFNSLVVDLTFPSAIDDFNVGYMTSPRHIMPLPVNTFET